MHIYLSMKLLIGSYKSKSGPDNHNRGRILVDFLSLVDYIFLIGDLDFMCPSVSVTKII